MENNYIDIGKLNISFGFENAVYIINKLNIKTNIIENMFLTREDIEFFGLEYIKTHAGLNEDYFEFNDNKHYMDYNYDKKYLRIAFGGDGDVTRFSGWIETKDEFEFILSKLKLLNCGK